MNTKEMIHILDSIARERNIERTVLVADLEQAMVTAARKHFGTLDVEEFKCTIDPITGDMQMFRHDEPIEMDPGALGRIAAQTFKQVMIQRFREDSRNSILEEFSKRIGEIVTGTAQRYEGGRLVVTVDRAEAKMPRAEQIPGEQFAPNDRVRCVILDVQSVPGDVQVVVSRAHPDFIRKLFEVEVPEVAERIIEIKAMAREAGYRTKMAVASVDSKVDAVGACVGVRGSRIRNIVDELNGEKIDIVRWNESSQILIGNALKPAEVSEISLCFELGRATVVVRDDQLSLAIGKRGQNVRLAARLTGWDIDILTPDEFQKGLDTLSETLLTVEGFNEEMVDRLAALGVISVFDVEEIGSEILVTELEVSEDAAEEAVEACSLKAKIVAEQQRVEKEEAEKKRLAAMEAAEESGSLVGLDADAAAAAILGGGPSSSESEADAQAAGILGGGEPSSEHDARAADILGGGD